MDIVTILLVEDNESDAFLISRAFKNMKIVNDLHICNNGEKAYNHLLSSSVDAPENMPDLILLDINMPVMDGREFLTKIKKNELLAHIPVIMLTSSSNDKEIVDFYRLGASSYLVKPIEFECLLDIVKAIEIFWVKLVKYKKKEDGNKDSSQ